MSMQPAYREDDIFMFDPAVETMARRDLEALQLNGIEPVKHAYDNVPHFRRKLDEVGVRPEHRETHRRCRPLSVREEERSAR